MGNKTFKIIFDNNIEVNYRLHDTELAEKWANKIKHLQNVPIDSIESRIEDFSDIKQIYSKFCKFADIDPIDLDPLNQDKLNQLHQIYEEQHDRLSRLKDNNILYRLHHAVHFHEGHSTKNIHVGWGTREGILTDQFECHKFYEDNIIKNYIYLPWSELGKKPRSYWKDQEPNDQKRFNTLAKPHTTFRAKFFIATKDKNPELFDENFVEWFDKYKQRWFEHHNIKKWDSVDEDSAPLLAMTDYKGSVEGLKFKKIII